MEEQRKILEYCTVAAFDLGDFDKLVQKALALDYQPYGNPFLGQSGRMIQVVVRYAPWTVEMALMKFKHDAGRTKETG